jgi:membrane protein DedA with SNARE-associated domain
MLEKLIGLLAVWIMGVISTMGYGGIVLLMAIESACIPLPSEIIMPFAGYLVFKGEMVLWIVAFMGALGCVLGSIPAYYVGKTGGRNLAEKYRPSPTCSKDFYSAPCRYCAHEYDEIHSLYLYRLIYLVLGARIRWNDLW